MAARDRRPSSGGCGRWALRERRLRRAVTVTRAALRGRGPAARGQLFNRRPCPAPHAPAQPMRRARARWPRPPAGYLRRAAGGGAVRDGAACRAERGRTERGNRAWLRCGRRRRPWASAPPAALPPGRWVRGTWGGVGAARSARWRCGGSVRAPLAGGRPVACRCGAFWAVLVSFCCLPEYLGVGLEGTACVCCLLRVVINVCFVPLLLKALANRFQHASAYAVSMPCIKALFSDVNVFRKQVSDNCFENNCWCIWMLLIFCSPHHLYLPTNALLLSPSNLLVFGLPGRWRPAGNSGARNGIQFSN